MSEVILQEFGQPIFYYPKLSFILGGIKEACFVSFLLSCLLDQGQENVWICKTQRQITEEIGLSRYEQETVRRNLRKIGVLKEKYQGLPCRLYFKLDLDRLAELLKNFQTFEKLSRERKLEQCV